MNRPALAFFMAFLAACTTATGSSARSQSQPQLVTGAPGSSVLLIEVFWLLDEAPCGQADLTSMELLASCLEETRRGRHIAISSDPQAMRQTGVRWAVRVD